MNLTDNETQVVMEGQEAKSSGPANVYLFNVVNDPEERQDLTRSHPQIVEMLLNRLAVWNTTAVPVNYPPVDVRCNPALRDDGVWGPWM